VGTFLFFKQVVVWDNVESPEGPKVTMDYDHPSSNFGITFDFYLKF